MIATANVSVAIGDLATAVAAAAGMQVLSGGLQLQNFAKDVLTVGGTALIASQIADVIEPRVEASFKSALSQVSIFDSYGSLITRFAVGTGVSMGLFYAAGMLPRPLGVASVIPSAVIGASMIVGHYVTTEYVKREAAKAAPEPK